MEGAGVFEDRGDGSTCWLTALSLQLSRDLDPPVLSLGVKKLPQPGVEGGQGRRGLGRWALAGGPTVGRDGSGEQEGQARDLGPRWVERR